MNKQFGWKLVAAICIASAVGCNKSSNTSGGTGGAGGSSPGAIIGASGTFVGASGTTAGMAGAGGSPLAPTTVMCGSTTCSTMIPNIPGFGGALPQVCCDTATSTCGLMSAGACQPRATPNPKCPNVSVFGQNAIGCCTDDGTTCGIDGFPLMAGCVSTDQIAMFPGVTVVPTHCDGTPIAAPVGSAGAGGQAGAAGHSGAGGASGVGGAAGHSGAGGAGGAAGHSGAGGMGGAGGAAGN